MDAYRGSLLVQATHPSRPRVVAIVDEAWQRTEAPPPGEIDEQWDTVYRRVRFVYCVAMPCRAEWYGGGRYMD